MLKKFLSEYFGFNKQQRRGLLLLAAFSIILLIVRITFPYFIHPDEIEIRNLPLLPIEKSDADSIHMTTHTRQANNDSLEFKSSHTQSHGSLFVFNPNTVSLKQLIQLGFKEKTASTFLKYRSKGFQFKNKEDLKKVYGVTESLYLSLEPFIKIESEYSDKVNKKSSMLSFKKIEINAADTQQLLSISIIDLSAAKRILKYKNRLGGFVSLVQLQEVYGFDLPYCKQLNTYFEVNALVIRKVNINQSTLNNLKNHPYIGEILAKQIVDFRKKTRFNLKNFSELVNDKELLEKLGPYLSFEE